MIETTTSKIPTSAFDKSGLLRGLDLVKFLIQLFQSLM